MPFPFEVPFERLAADVESYVDQVFGALESEFLRMPKGEGFVEYSAFAAAYESLKQATNGFRAMQSDDLFPVVCSQPLSLVVLRTMLGFSPPEWAYVASQFGATVVPQGAARTIDRRVRMRPDQPLPSTGISAARVRSLVDVAARLLSEGAPSESSRVVHRLCKADTLDGLQSIRAAAELGVPYAMLLYERFLGRPFASHRDSVSEQVGDILESAIEDVLCAAGVSYRKTKRAQRVVGFDQAPDFVVPDEFAPQIVIEAKLTEDDGTARDKVTRVQHLAALSRQGLAADEPPRFEVVACIAGRGFKVRREDMRKLLLATRGKVFTLRNLDQLVSCTGLSGFRVIERLSGKNRRETRS